MVDRHTYSCWARIFPAPDLPEQWIAYCLNLGVVSQGNDPMHAAEMVREACALVVADDLNSGFDPLDRNADPSDWEAFYELLEHAHGMSVHDIAASGKTMVLAFDLVARFTNTETSVQIAGRRDAITLAA